jgi:hypothetical protein
MPNLATALAGFQTRYVIPSYNQVATWMAVITDQTPGATPSASVDPYRQQPVSFGDGTYGVGWTTSTRNGYLAPVQINVGVDDAFTLEEETQDGLLRYTAPVVIYPASITLAKGDLLALAAPDNRRFIVADQVMQQEVFGQGTFRIAKLQKPEAGAIALTIPLT